MKYDDREMMILLEGMWYGIASAFFGISVAAFSEIPLTKNSWVIGTFLGCFFIILGVYSNKKEQQLSNSESD